MQEILRNCRCCLKSPASDYFNEFVEFNKNVDHSQKIVDLFENLTSIKVDFTDLENSKICGDCLEKLKNSYEFREMCLNSNRQIQEALFETKEENSVVPEFIAIKLELKEENIEEHMVLDTDQKQVDPTNIESSEKGLKIKFRKSREKTNRQIKTKKTKAATESRTLEAKENIAKRKTDNSTKDNATSKEEKPSRKKGNRTPNKNSYSCSYCAKIFPSKVKCSRHEKSVHIREMKFACDHCEKKYMKRCEIVYHLYSHFNIKNHACEICSKAFVSNQQKEAHKKCFHKLAEKDVACPHCDLKFFHKSAMEIHSAVHMNERPFICSFEGCGKAFRNQKSLKDHSRYHLPQSLECNICEMKFKHIFTYQTHMKHHELEAANIVFTCEICSRTFKRKAILMCHKRNMHSNSKPYKCGYCDMSFVMRHKLTTHIYSKHISNTFQCELCPQTFKLKKYFQKAYASHVENQHTELNPEELEKFQRKIKSLKFLDLATDFPANYPALEGKECNNCHLMFTNARQLEAHKKSKCTKI